LNSFDEKAKNAIIKKLKRILRLPMRELLLPIEAKFGVYTAYVY
jgi:hypothetical protein